MIDQTLLMIPYCRIPQYFLPSPVSPNPLFPIHLRAFLLVRIPVIQNSESAGNVVHFRSCRNGTYTLSLPQITCPCHGLHLIENPFSSSKFTLVRLHPTLTHIVEDE